MKRVLITGAAGFIGSSLADALLARGDSVFGIDDFNDYYSSAIKEENVAGARLSADYTLRRGDICDGDFVAQAFGEARADVVVHLAVRAGVRPSIEDPALYQRVNVIGSQHILDACRAASPSHLVFASSSSVYGGSTRVPFREDDPVGAPYKPLCRDEANERADGACLSPRLRARRDDASFLFGVWPTAAAGHGRSQVHAAHQRWRGGAHVRRWVHKPRLHLYR